MNMSEISIAKDHRYSHIYDHEIEKIHSRNIDVRYMYLFALVFVCIPTLVYIKS